MARVGVGCQADRQQRRGRRVGVQQRGGGDVGHAAVVIQRADDAGDPETQFPARSEGERERLPRAEPERLGQALADLGLAGSPQAPAAGQGRRLEGRVVARVGDHIDRLAERERVDRLDVVTRGDCLHTGDSSHRRRGACGQRGGELVALAQRPGVGLQRAQLGGERQHQQHERRRQPEGDDGRDQPGAARGNEPHAERGQPRRAQRPQAGDSSADPLGDISAAQQRDDRARGRPPRRPCRPRDRDRHRRQPAGQDGEHESPPGAWLVEQRQQPVGRPVDGEHPGRAADSRGGRGDERRLHAMDQREIPPGSADGALHADRTQPPLYLGARGGGEHRPRGRQRDQRQRHQQIDDNAGGLVEQDPHPRASGEADVVDPKAGRPGLDEQLAEIARVASPYLGVVDTWVMLGAKARAQRAAGQVEARLGERKTDVVRRLHQSHDSFGPQVADVHRVARTQAPGLRERLLDQHLVAGRAQVASVHDRVAAPPP